MVATFAVLALFAAAAPTSAAAAPAPAVGGPAPAPAPAPAVGGPAAGPAGAPLAAPGTPPSPPAGPAATTLPAALQGILGGGGTPSTRALGPVSPPTISRRPGDATAGRAGATTTTAGPTPPTVPGGNGELAKPPSEVPADEARLIALIGEVHGRIASLASQVAGLNAQITANQTAYRAATDLLAAQQAAAYAADRKVDSVEVNASGARQRMRTRAVAAYVHQPTGDLANMLLHLQDPATLIDARGFYQTLVDLQVQAIRAYDRLGKEAKTAARAAGAARDAAVQQQAAVAAQRQLLQTLKQTIEQVQQASGSQEAQQTQLLTQINIDKAKFAAEVAAQAAQSANIVGLLVSLSKPGDTTVAPTGGYFTLPTPGAQLTQGFGPNFDPFTGAGGFHPGVDFAAATGTPIHAAGDGVVVFAADNGGYGNYTCINHGHNIATCYAHQSAILVTPAATVTGGQVIGLMGSTGYSTGPHLHFEVRVNGQPTNPIPWLAAKAPAPATTTSTP